MLTVAIAFTSLIGLGCLLGATVILRGNSADWPDVVASESILRRVGIGLAIESMLVLGSAIALASKISYSEHFVFVSTAIFVACGFWGNRVVFGDYRPMHTGANVILAAIVWIFLALS